MRGSKVNIWRYIDKIAPFLQRGCNINQACIMAGIPSQTIYAYMDNDKEVKDEIEKYKEHSKVLAKQVWVQAIEKKDWRAAKEWLEKVAPEEFGSKIKVDVNAEIKVKDTSEYKEAVDRAVNELLTGCKLS